MQMIPQDRKLGDKSGYDITFRNALYECTNCTHFKISQSKLCVLLYGDYFLRVKDAFLHSPKVPHGLGENARKV